MRILLTPTIRESALEAARRLLPDGVEMLLGDPVEGEVFLDKVASVDALVGYFRTFPRQGWAAGRGRVRMAQMLPAGYDNVDIEAARAAGIPICMNGGANAVGVAEHAVMLMLAALRSLPDLVIQTRGGAWRPAVDNRRYYELGGRTVGVVGLGNIGSQVARCLRGFDVDIVYFDPIRRSPEQEAELGVTYRSLATLFEVSDIVTLHSPLTSDNHHLVDATRLASMKPGALLVNTARAQLVDEAALVAALDSGQLSWAALDTVDPEPAPPGHPLLSHPRAFVTPHTAGTTEESWPRRFANAFANVQRVGRGEDPLWVIPELRDLVDARPEQTA